MPLLRELKIYALMDLSYTINTRSTCCVQHWFKELDDPQAAAGPSQAFADTPILAIGQSLLKLDESQRKRLESLFNTTVLAVHFLSILVKDDPRKFIYL
jgi:hypothetical protein